MNKYSTASSKKIELLAPAKNKETAFAAIDCGADAVYIGAPAFGARQNASNSLEDIKEVVKYAHKFWAKVHVTVNTILTDSELDEAVELIHKLSDIGVDAVIIQDMGLLNKLMSAKFKLPQLHMSTQCDNYLPQKIKFFNNIGVSRVVLARELSIEQIKQIHNENPDLELESFIHGALCVSMSGQCYLSQYIGGRSANRGECAQPCRKQYDVIDDSGNVIAKNIYPLCLKDFNGGKYIEELVNAGVCSFKIEGRLKDIGYVKNVVAHYRSLLGKGASSGKVNISAPSKGEAARSAVGGNYIYPFTPNPEKTFNRGFTDYFLKSRNKCFSMDSPKSKGEYLGKVVEVNKDYFVIETDKEIHSQDGLYFNNDGCLVNKGVNIGVNMEVNINTPSNPPIQGEDKANAPSNSSILVEDRIKIYPNKKVSINIGDEVYRNFDVEFEKELSKPVKRQIAIEVNLSAPFHGEVLVSPTLSAPFHGEVPEGQRGLLKQSRSAAGGVYLILTDEDGVSLTETIHYMELAKNPEKMNETFVKQFSKTGDSDFYIENIEISPETELPFMPVSTVNELRRTLFEKLMNKRLEMYEENRLYQKPMKHTKYFVSEVDYRANVHNKSAKEFYEKCGAKVKEYSLETKVPNRQIELMRCKHCIKYALNMCKSSKKLYLKDTHGKIYPLKFDCKKCEMYVLNSI